VSFGSELDRERAKVMRAVRQAGNNWAQAMRAHKMAPPDLGFASRLRSLSEAAASEQIAWEYAHAAGLQWRPIPNADRAEPPYELRPGTGRRGPADLWALFDDAVTTLNRAIMGTHAATVADAFGDLSEVAGRLSDAVADEDAARAPDVGAHRAQGAA
jgi:hypothetical protein